MPYPPFSFLCMKIAPWSFKYVSILSYLTHPPKCIQYSLLQGQKDYLTFSLFTKTIYIPLALLENTNPGHVCKDFVLKSILERLG